MAGGASGLLYRSAAAAVLQVPGLQAVRLMIQEAAWAHKPSKQKQAYFSRWGLRAGPQAGSSQGAVQVPGQGEMQHIWSRTGLDLCCVA